MKKKNKLIFLATLSTACLLSLASCQGAQGPKGDQGNPGINGTNGTDGKNGEDGKDGNSVRTGKGAPASTLGKDGDSYIDTETFDFYVKADGKWSKEGNIKGAAGDAGSEGEEGAKGEDGTSIRTGKGEPSDTLGNDGDSYIDLSTFDFYVKEDGKWSKEGNIKGEKGEQGEKGDQGDKGWNGSQGSQGDPGKTAWSNTILPSSGGYVTVDIGSAVEGTNVTFTAHPDTSTTTYYLDEMIITGEGFKDQTSSLTRTYEMIKGGFVVQAKFTTTDTTNQKTVKGNDGELYDSVNEAIANKCTSVTLEKDSTLKESINIPAGTSLTIDLNEHELKCANYQIGVCGELIFVNKNGEGKAKKVTGENVTGIVSLGKTITSGTPSTVVTQTASRKLDGGKFNTISTMSTGLNVTNGDNSVDIGAQVIFSLNIDGPAIKSMVDGATIKVNENAKFECKTSAIEVVGGSATLSGTINSTSGTAVKVNGGKVNVDSSAKINATETSKAIEVSSGSLNVEGSVSSASSDAITVSGGSVDIKGSVSSTSANAISVSAGVLNVTGGTVTTSSRSSAAIDVSGTSTVTVTGGTVKNTSTNVEGESDGTAIKQSGTDSTVKVEDKATVTGVGYKLSLANEGTHIKGVSDGKYTAGTTIRLTIDGKNGEQVLTGLKVTGDEQNSVVSYTKGFYYNEDEDGNITYTYDLVMPSYDATISAIYGDSADEVSYYVTEINDLEEFKLFRDSVNSGVTYEGVSVKLNSDIDLKDEKTWTPIGKGTRGKYDNNGFTYETNTTKPFKGVFDGQSHKVENLSYDAKVSEVKDDVFGLFGVVDGGTIKNLTVNKFSIKENISQNVGAVAGLIVCNSTIENVTVNESSVEGQKAVGGIVGRMTIEGTIKNCHFNNGEVKSPEANKGSAGGIVGHAYYTREGKEMNIIGCSNSGNITDGYEVGGIAGFCSSNVIGCSNIGTVSSAKAWAAGGIVGEQTTYGEVSGCSNSGTVNSGKTDNSGGSDGTLITNGASISGGIIGWIRYKGTTDSAYTGYEIIEVSNNTNTGNVTGVRAAGGIIGDVYNAVNCHDNTNKDCTITATTFACGIATIQRDSGRYYDDYAFTFKNNTSSSTTLSGNCQKEKIWNNLSPNVKDEDLN